jgi:hypothetical protein
LDVSVGPMDFASLDDCYCVGVRIEFFQSDIQCSRLYELLYRATYYSGYVFRVEGGEEDEGGGK